MSAKSIPENTTPVHTFTASEGVTWTLPSGDDAAKFSINSSGELRFVTAPNFEAPNDLGATANNNTYVVVVRATDAAGNFSEQTVTVTDVNDIAPVNTASGGTTAAIEQVAIAVDANVSVTDVDSPQSLAGVVTQYRSRVRLGRSRVEEVKTGA